ncbi:sporulation protein [Paenibacillus lautus]|uniref:sporulation protein n=1 Tax=Paenibacillus lautus TaxID=1401 RepID=UPI002DB9120F|nr:sporulation protein [Paenibacillus lautus]MEC0305416.1 sporulation protein [Paenibacillus lautus]
MSFFNKMLASVGIGAAQIDTHLEKSSYYPGEEVRGVIHIKGGNVEQTVDRIYLKLMTEYTRESDDKKYIESYTLAKINVSSRLTLKPGDQQEIPFSFPLPLETPLTISRQPVWIHTGLDIDNAIDPKDRDFIDVEPNAGASVVFGAVEGLGFSFKMATCEYHPRLGQGVPFVQEIEFYPGSSYAGHIKELELILYPEQDGISVLVEVDRRGRGVSGWLQRSLDMDEQHSWVTLDQQDLEQGPSHVAQIIDRVIRRSI